MDYKSVSIKILISFLFSLSVFNRSSQILAATPNQTINVNFLNIISSSTQRASGTFAGSYSSVPNFETVFQTYWAPLKFNLFTWIKPEQTNNGTITFPALNYAMRIDAYYQTKIYRNPGDLTLGINSAWGQYVTSIAQAALATGYNKMQLDILNEPDWSSYWPFTGNLNDTRILDAWRIAYIAAKSVSPNLELVGPNVLAGNISWLKNTFLPTMKAEGRLPDILSWHEINTPIGNIADNVNSMRAYLAQNGMTQVRDISINEYNYTNSYLSPAKTVHFISQLEKAKVLSASRACWEGSPCAPQINSLLDQNGSPRSVWWTYKLYADMTGSIVSTVDPPSFASIASKNTNDGSYRVLVGSVGSEASLSINMTNLINTSYNIKVEKIPNSGSTALTAPTLVQNYHAQPISGIIDVTINQDSPDQAFNIVLTPSGSGITPSPTGTYKPGDVNRDGRVDILDFQLLSNSFGKVFGQIGFNQYTDLNGDNRVDILDFQILSNNFG